MNLARLVTTLAALALAAALFAGLSATADATETYRAIYVFGDSLSDAGNDWIGSLRTEPKSPPYFRGRFSNGRTWVEDLAVALNLAAPKPSLAGGHDFAFGGAESGHTLVHALSETPPDLPLQVAAFRLQVPKPAATALYVVWIGANDLIDMLSHTPALTPAQVDKGIRQVVGNETAAIAALAALGARRVLVVTVPDLGHVPAIAVLGATAAADATALAAAFDAALGTAVRAEATRLGLELTLADAFATLDAIIADPHAHGFTDVVDPCWTGAFTGGGGTLCSKLKSVQNQHLFWDRLHPTAAAHALIAATAKAQLP